MFQFVHEVPTSIKSGLSLVIHGDPLPLPLDALTSILAFFLYWRWSPYVSPLLNDPAWDILELVSENGIITHNQPSDIC